MIEILDSGPLATVQDLGRPGYQHLGVGRSGAADAEAHLLANRLVGNHDSAATVEATMGGLRFRLLQAATIAFTGAPVGVTACRGEGTIGGEGTSFREGTIGGENSSRGQGSRLGEGNGRWSLAWNSAVSLPAGTWVSLGTPAAGLRSYLAVRGGVDAPAVLGSRSTDTLSGLGPSALRPGARLSIGSEVSADPRDDVVARSRHIVRPLRLIMGPRVELFTAAAAELLVSSIWSVRPTSNRIGLRLAGPVLERLGGSPELASEPTLPGAIQIPPDGQPIVLGPDAPVTGGYPVIAVVRHADLPALGQLRPGDPVRFRPDHGIVPEPTNRG